MEIAIVLAQSEPTREVIRDARGVVIGTVERQKQAGMLVARDRRGIVVGRFNRTGTRTADGRLISPSNLLPALLLER